MPGHFRFPEREAGGRGSYNWRLGQSPGRSPQRLPTAKRCSGLPSHIHACLPHCDLGPPAVTTPLLQRKKPKHREHMSPRSHKITQPGRGELRLDRGGR